MRRIAACSFGMRETENTKQNPLFYIMCSQTALDHDYLLAKKRGELKEIGILTLEEFAASIEESVA